MRFRIINAQPTRKFQLICLRFKIIRYYRLNIARDVIHEAIYWARVYPILKSPFLSIHECCSNLIAMSNSLDNLQTNSWQSYFILTPEKYERLWTFK